ERWLLVDEFSMFGGDAVPGVDKGGRRDDDRGRLGGERGRLADERLLDGRFAHRRGCGGLWRRVERFQIAAFSRRLSQVRGNLLAEDRRIAAVGCGGFLIAAAPPFREDASSSGAGARLGSR